MGTQQWKEFQKGIKKAKRRAKWRRLLRKLGL